MAKAKVFDTSSAFGGMTSLQNQNVTDMQNFNQSGFIGQLFGKKKGMKNKSSSIL